MKARNVIIPRGLIVGFFPHPEEYGEAMVELDNGSYTDIYTNKEGFIYTPTNDEVIIEYLKNKPIANPAIIIEKDGFTLRSVLFEDAPLIAEKQYSQLDKERDLAKETIRMFLSHGISKYSHLLMIETKGLEVGLLGYSIMNNTCIIHIDVFNEEKLNVIAFKSVFGKLAHKIDSLYQVSNFKANVKGENLHMQGLLNTIGFYQENIDQGTRLKEECVFSFSLRETENSL